MVEAEDAGYDFAKLSLDGNQLARIDSQGSEAGCTGFSGEETGVTVLVAGVREITVEYDTVDALFHTDEFGVEFEITSCIIADA